MSKRKTGTIRELDNLKEILTYSCRKYAEMPAFFEKSKETGKYEKVTFNELYEYVTAFGTILCSELNLKGKRIAIISENRYQWVVSFLGVVCGTGVVVPIDRALFPSSDVANLLTKARCEAIIFSESKKEMVEEIAPSLPFVKHLICMDDVPNMGNSLSFWSLIEKGRALLKGGDRTFVDAEINNTALAILLFTSGTTAGAKGVMLSHSNLASNIYSVGCDIDLREGDVTYSLLPLHHIYECLVELLVLYCGASIAVCEGLRFIPDNLAEIKPDILVTVPAFLEKIIKKVSYILEKDGKKAVVDIINSNPKQLAGFPPEAREALFAGIKSNFGGKLRLILSGAAQLDDKHREFFQTVGLDVLVGYGLTETSPVSTLYHTDESSLVSIGKPIPGVQVKISDPGEDGSGEICIKGPNVMIGYLDDEEATKDVIDDDGWFSSGDMGYIDAEGFVHINGRKKEMIGLPNGKKVFPMDIEPLFNTYPIIKEAIICNMSDQPGKEKVGALIVIDEEYGQNFLSDDQNDIHQIIQGIIAEINTKVARYKRIMGFRIRKEDFPKTTTSKIKRHLVKWTDS
jgi:long-chain acyl-CoA synthetase